MATKVNYSQSIFYRRNLPHIHPTDHMFFITFRLARSLPIRTVLKLKSGMKTELKLLAREKDIKNYKSIKYKVYSAYFKKFDDMLAKNKTGPL